MNKFLILYYDGNENKMAIVNSDSQFNACSKLFDGRIEGITWEEGVQYVIDIGKSRIDIDQLIIFDNCPGSGRFVNGYEIEEL